MADILNDAMTWLAAAQTSHLSELVSLTRVVGNYPVTTTDVPAMIAEQAEPVIDDYGALVVPVTDIVFGIDAAEYLIDSAASQPQPGDIITRTALDGDPQYEVAQPSGTEKPWEWADGYEIKMRVHAKRVT